MLSLLDANTALILASAGVLLICAEFCLPGWVVPGVTGGVCLVCGAHRLSMLDSSAAAAAGVAVALLGVAAAGYGLIPEWIALPLVLGVPWLCRLLLPGFIQWPVATLAAVPPMAAFFLLRIAARAAANKTLLQ
jgi:membrane-bound serine protease (ClpP class)